MTKQEVEMENRKLRLDSTHSGTNRTSRSCTKILAQTCNYIVGNRENREESEMDRVLNVTDR
jgi:hypothetical protein